MFQFKDIKIDQLEAIKERKGFIGEKIKLQYILNHSIIMHRYEIKQSKFNEGSNNCLYMQIELNNQMRVFFTGSKNLMDIIELIPKENFPFITTIIKSANDSLIFT